MIVSGMGKAGLVGQKIMATLASTGTPSHCLHPAEAVHGDLGRIHRDDLADPLPERRDGGDRAAACPRWPSWACRSLPSPAGRKHAGPGRRGPRLGPLEEACPLGLAPSSSTTAMLAVGDALGW